MSERSHSRLMSRRLFTFLIGAFVVITVATSCDGNDETQPTQEALGNPSAATAKPPPANIAAAFVCGMKPSMIKTHAEKGATFFETWGKLKDIRGLSEGTELRRELLRKSVKTLASRTESTELKFNYVVGTEDCKIYVATWISDPDYGPGEMVGESLCRSDLDDSDLSRHTAGDMIDISQEKLKQNPTSPCWLDLASLNANDEKKNLGILDAISKHMILAQPAGYRSLATIDITTLDKAKVLYAGEIVVEIKSKPDGSGKTCKYSINNDSGTYQPELASLNLVALYFNETIEEMPDLPGNINSSNGSDLCSEPQAS